jgi:hypothetical protein
MAPILARNAAYLNVPLGVVVKLTSGLSMTDLTIWSNPALNAS